MEAHHCPPGLHALWGLCAAGVGGGCSQGKWPATVVTGVWCQALSFPRPPVLWGGQPGFRDPCVPGAVGAGVGPSTSPTACALAGRRCSLWEWRNGVPGGVFYTFVRGVCGQPLPLPELPAHWAGCWGPQPTCCGRRRVGWGPNIVCLACMPSGGCVPRGWWGFVPGGGAGLPPL